MDAVLEGWLNRTWTKMQEIIITFKKQIDKQTQRLVYVEGKMRQIEELVKAEPNFDEGDLVDLRARVANLEGTTKNKLNRMFDLCVAMKEKLIAFDSRIELLEDKLDEIDKPIGEQDEEDAPPMSEAEKAVKKVDDALAQLNEDTEDAPNEDEDKKEEETQTDGRICLKCGKQSTMMTMCSECDFNFLRNVVCPICGEVGEKGNKNCEACGTELPKW